MTLDELGTGHEATIDHVRALVTPDPIAARLDALGFVADEPVRMLAYGPFGREPLLVAIGHTRFALRRSEAARVVIRPK